MGDGRWEMGDGRWEMGDENQALEGRKEGKNEERLRETGRESVSLLLSSSVALVVVVVVVSAGE